MINVEQAFAEIVRLMVKAEDGVKLGSIELVHLLVRLTCKMATQFWLDSQCFEKFVVDLKQSFDPTQQTGIVS